MLFTSGGKWSKEVDRRIVKAKSVLCELSRSLVTKWELSNTAKVSRFKSFFVPTLTCGRESWLMTGRVLSEVQVTEMGFCQEFTW